ncbi:hypothetical protein [Spelaeicoccus albus]|uniref:Uncharacterized protein n=1 Tax=Spelaeicoccus albus TaxID=1280376 RepID=A0A7Z0D3W7_9MICO|nr:hypothetical protein [Spelaeicoccus albus]NYI68380.1 hypothetical protein [Spelaeicoccus albus]
MNAYTRTWWRVWIVFACVVAGLAFAAWTIQIGVFFVLGAAAGVIVVVRRNHARLPRGDLIRRAARVGARTGIFTSAVIACGRLGGTLVWPVILVAVLTCPALTGIVTKYTDKLRPMRLPAVPDADRADAAGFGKILAGVDDDELCRAWFESYALLQRQAATNNGQYVVSYRQACLDELERRHPAEMHKWLESEPPPTANPRNFFKAD